MTKKIILGVLSIIILVFGGITAYVMMLDWNEHKASLAGRISDLIGEKVEFSGNLKVSVFPKPYIYAENVQIINPETSEKLASIDKLSASVSLISILKKIPNIQTLEIDGMEMWLKIKENGSINWAQTQQPDFLSGSNGGELQSFSLYNSEVHLENQKNNLSFDLKNLTADIQAYSLQGPYHFDGNFTMENEPFAMSIGLGSISRDDDMSLSANITHSKSKSFLRYDGAWNVGKKQFNGVISGSSEKTADFLNILAHKKLLDTDYNVALNFSGNIDKTDKYLNLDTLVIKFAKLLNGSGNVHIPFVNEDTDKKPEATVKYQMVDLDIRPFINIIKNQSAEYLNGKEYLPDTHMNVVFDLSAAHLIVSDEIGGYFESTSAKGTWKDNALTLEEFFAACPGNITLQMDGSLVEENKKPQYYAKVSVDGQNFLTLLNAIGFNITAPVQSSYRNPVLSFIVLGDSQEVKLQNIALEMDKMSLKSEVAILFSDNLYKINVSTDKINLDNYVNMSEDQEKVGIQERIGSMLEKLGDNKLQLDVTAKNLVFKGITSDNFVFDALLDKDLLQIKKLQADGYMDSDLKLSGSFSDFNTGNTSFDKVDVDIKTNDVLALAQNLQIDIPKYAFYDRKDIGIVGTLSGKENDLTIDAKISNEGTNATFNGKLLNYTNSEPASFDGNVSLKTLNFAKFLQGIDVSSDNFLSQIGVFNADAAIDGSKNNINFKQFDVVMGKEKYSGSGTLKKNNEKYIIKGKVDVNEFQLNNFMRFEKGTIKTQGSQESAEFLNKPEFNQDIIDYKIYDNIELDVNITADKAFYGDNVFEKLQTRIINKDKILQIKDIASVYDGSIVKGNLDIDYQKDPSVKGSLDFSNIMITSLGGTVYILDADTLHAVMSFEASADSVAHAIYSMNGDIRLDGTKLLIHGIDLHAIAEDLRTRDRSQGVFQAVRDKLVSGSTSFDTVTGRIIAKGGVFNFETLELQNAEENVILTGNFVPEEWKTKAEFTVKYKEYTDIPVYSFSLAGILNKPILDIDISDIVKKYDAHWDNLEKEELTKKIAEQEALSERMTQAQDFVTSLENKVNDVRPKIEQYKEKSDISANIAQYVKKEELLNDIDNNLYKMKGLGNQSDFTENDVTDIENKCKDYDKNLTDLPKFLDELYAQDVKDRLENALKEVYNINDESKKLFDEYQKMVQDDFNALLEINASQYMVNNAELKTDQAQMTGLSDKILELKDKAQSVYTASEAFKQADEYEVTVIELKQNSTEMLDILNKMRDIRKKSADMLLKIIEERREIYQKEEERKERDKKEQQKEDETQEETDDLVAAYQEQISENENMLKVENNVSGDEAENINVVKGGIKTKYDESYPQEKLDKVNSQNSVLVEIKDKKSEESMASGAIKKSYDEVVNENQINNQGILKQIDGEIQKASGTIKLK